MAKRNNSKRRESFEREGFRPTNVGYQPEEPSDFISSASGSKLPRAPKAGTDKEGRRSEKFGFRPTNVGYQAEEPRDFIPSAPGSKLPKAPKGGTGESPAPSTDSGSSKTSR